MSAVTPAHFGRKLLVGGGGSAFGDRVGDLRCEEPDGAEGVVVAGDHVVDDGGIAVGIDDGDDGDAELAGFLDGDGFVRGVDDEDGVGEAAHVLDAGEIGLEVLALALELDDFLLGEQVVAAVGGHLIEFLKALHRFLHGDPVGEEAAEPALVDVEHAAAGGFFGDGVLRLALGADEQHDFALGGEFGDELRRLLEHLEGLLQIDDVNAVALAEDVLLHPWIPALGLMPEVDSGFEQLLHGDSGQTTSLLDCIPAGCAGRN